MKLFGKLSAAAMAFVLVFGITACGSTTNAKKIEVTDENIGTVLTDTKERLTKVNESDAVMTMSIDLATANGEDRTYAVNTSEIKSRKDPELKYVKTTSTQDGEDYGEALEYYIAEENKEYSLYAKYEGEWYKQGIENYYTGYIFNEYNTTENAVLLLNYMENAVVDGEENGLTKVSGEISTENVYALVSGTGAFNMVFSAIDATLFDIKEAVPAKLWLDETGMLAAYEIDYTNAVNDVFATFYKNYYGIAETESLINTEEYKIKVEVKEYDNIKDFAIPEEVKAAKDFADVAGDEINVIEE